MAVRENILTESYLLSVQSVRSDSVTNVKMEKPQTLPDGHTGVTCGGEHPVMATCPACQEQVRPVIDPAATPEDAGWGIAAATWVCPKCEAILGVSEVDLLPPIMRKAGNEGPQ